MIAAGGSERAGLERLDLALQMLAGRQDLERERHPGSRLSLAEAAALLAALGHPEEGPRIAHVGGSKGKGSTVLILAALLRAAGIPAGAYLSPHLEGWGERFLRGCVPAPPGELAAALEEAAAALPAAPAASFFDLLTAAAFLLFRRWGVAAAAVEVGLGGRLDSTNLVRPGVVVLTGIEREHEDLLGRGLARVAAEKAGIIKAGVPVVTACRGRALAVMAAAAAAVQAPMRVLGRDFTVRAVGRGVAGWEVELGRPGGPTWRLPTALKGRPLLVSLGLAAEAFAVLMGRRPEPELLAAAAARPLPGRCELVGGEPPWLLDGAHTARSLVRLGREARSWAPGRRWLLLFGVARDKRWQRAFRALAGRAAATLVVALPGGRGVPAAELKAAAPAGAEIQPSLDMACFALQDRARPGDLVVATGSFQVAGGARAWLRREGRLLDEPG